MTGAREKKYILYTLQTCHVCLFSVPLTFCVSILRPLMCWSQKSIIFKQNPHSHTCTHAHARTQTRAFSHLGMVKRRRLTYTHASARSSLEKERWRPIFACLLCARCIRTHARTCDIYLFIHVYCTAALFRYLKRWISGGGTLVINVYIRTRQCARHFGDIANATRDIHVCFFIFIFSFFSHFFIFTALVPGDACVPSALLICYARESPRVKVGCPPIYMSAKPHQSAQSGNQKDFKRNKNEISRCAWRSFRKGFFSGRKINNTYLPDVP